MECRFSNSSSRRNRRSPAHRVSSPSGLKMVAPVLMAFGNPEQQRRFLPKIRSGETWWCQGIFRAGRRPRISPRCAPAAVRDGGQYVVNGQKTWNTPRPVRRLDVLPGAHPTRRPSREAGDSVPLDRHEKRWRQGAADRRSSMAAARSTISSSRTYGCRWRTSSGRRTRVDLREVVDRPRAQQHRGYRRRRSANPRTAEARSRRKNARTDGRLCDDPLFAVPAGASRDRLARARNHEFARLVRGRRRTHAGS